MKKTMIELENVTKVYMTGEVEVPAIRNISLKIMEGEFVAIMGPSGSGKSTLMNMIGCLDIPTSGKVLLDGHDISEMSGNRLARLRGSSIGFIFQFFNLYPTLNVIDNVALPMRIHNYGERKVRQRSAELLGMVGLEKRVEHYPSQLSGGEIQRVAIARALTTEPSIILADEPTGNIDSKSAKEIMGFLYRLNAKEKKTIIMVTHDLNIAKHARRIIRIMDGQIVKGG